MNSLLKLRKSSGLSQQALADYLGVSRSLINLTEKGLRELPKEALIKLGDIEKVTAMAEFNKKSAAAALDEKTSKELREYHQLKIEDYLYKAEGLSRQLSLMLKNQQKSDAKLKLVSGLSKNNSKSRKNKFHEIWTEYHGQESNEKLSKYISIIQMLTCDIEVMLGYAAVHEKVLKKIF